MRVISVKPKNDYIIIVIIYSNPMDLQHVWLNINKK